jgi:CheY-like chemotaxis protein
MPTILLVHPNDAVRKNYREMLTNAGLEVVDVKTGEQVFNIWTQHNFDLVLATDLPDCSMGPFELSKWIMKFQEAMGKPAIPFVLMTWGPEQIANRHFDVILTAPLSLSHLQLITDRLKAKK